MIKEYCGLFGVFGQKEAAKEVFLGLYSLQHRGEESCGITSFDGEVFCNHRGMGLVGDVFNETILNSLKGYQAIGHVRYSTTGSTAIRNIQPLFVDSRRGSLSLAHNGNLLNSRLLREKLEDRGAIFQSSSDSEIILHLMMRAKGESFLDKMRYATGKIRGAYSLLIMNDRLVAGMRDPLGFRPLCIGKKGDSFYISSESCALDLVGAEFVREVDPGELVWVDKNGLHSERIFPSLKKKAFCSFEHIYFSRPDSFVFGQNVHLVREELGRALAKEHPVEADVVVGVPDSGTSAALGFSKESNIPLGLGIIRNHYIGRTFIQPYQSERELAARLKFNILKEVVSNKRIVIIDDSIVRGTTSRIRVKNLKSLGAKEVHLRISCPPHRFGCFYGIDFPDKNRLIANKMSLEEERRFLEVDSIGYLSLEGMLRCFRYSANNYCTACWSGNYPLKSKQELNKFALERGNQY